MEITPFYDEYTGTLTYVVADKKSKDAVIIDPLMNYDQSSSTFSYESLDRVIEHVFAQGLHIHYILETHAHADHLSGAQKLKEKFSQAKLAIGEKIIEVQSIFKEVFNLKDEFVPNGSHFDCLLKDDESFNAGAINIKVMATPGHTIACSSYLIEDVIFTGDALFMPDFGVARCDFPGGSAKELYNSVKNKLYNLPENTRIFTAHDYKPGGRELRFESTIKESREKNIHINDQTTCEDFVRFRNERDKSLNAPKLLFPSVLVNIYGGRLPKAESNGQRYLKIPLRPKTTRQI